MAHCDIVIACTKAKGYGSVCVCVKRGPALGAGLFQHTHGIASCFGSSCFHILWEVRHITSETTKIISCEKFRLARLALSVYWPGRLWPWINGESIFASCWTVSYPVGTKWYSSWGIKLSALLLVIFPPMYLRGIVLIPLTCFPSDLPHYVTLNQRYIFCTFLCVCGVHIWTRLPCAADCVH